MARDGKCSVHRNPSLAISASALGLPIVRETHSRGSLIPPEFSAENRDRPQKAAASCEIMEDFSWKNQKRRCQMA